MLTQERLKELLDYDPETGVFTWKVNRGPAKIGKVIGSLETRGYLTGYVDGNHYKLHRLAWLYVNGELPPDQIDHINGCRTDNRMSNLRLATRKENLENQKIRSDNKSGYRGVSWYKETSKWKAQIQSNKTKYSLGYFNTPEEASEVYEKARDRLFTHHKTPYAA